jgi:hypothetical protein
MLSNDWLSLGFLLVTRVKLAMSLEELMLAMNLGLMMDNHINL